MARFGSNLNPGSTTGATVLAATASTTLTTPSNNLSVGLNESGGGSLNRSSVGAGSSSGSRGYCGARLVAFNVHHTLVKSYPSFFIIPQVILFYL